MIAAGRWPDRFDCTGPFDEWRRVREAFAAQTPAWRWAIVDGAYSDLQRTARMVEPGQPFDDTAAGVLRSLRDAVLNAEDAVTPLTASWWDRRRTVRALNTARDRRPPG